MPARPDEGVTANLAELPATRLRGVGPQLATRLAGLESHSVQVVLFRLPLRYQDRTRVVPIAALQPGQDAVIEGEVRVADVVFGRRRSLVCRLQDGSGTITLRFFHFSQAQRNQLQTGVRLRCYGEARRGPSGLELIHPEYRLRDPQGDAEAGLEQTLTPVYPSTEGIGQAQWRRLSAAALDLLDEDSLPDYLPPGPQLPGGGIGLAAALRLLHAPPASTPPVALADGRHPAQQRLAFEELLAHQLSLLRLRAETRRLGAPVLGGPDTLQQRLLQQLPFPLTGAQRRVAAEIDADLRQPQPMLRLLQGDVGAGKTVVAALAALRAVASDYQVALMAPTELLAEQHLHNFLSWLDPLGVKIAWLSGRSKARERREALASIAAGEVAVAIGTHALFQDQVRFARLGLVIVDEQHRFGVHQRLALSEKAAGVPHQLTMTATPIPRTLAMSAYADLDTSVIDELPPGRVPVSTAVIANERREAVITRVREACHGGRQAYWVCTLIEESEALEAQAAEATWTELSAQLPELRIGLLHGRLKSPEKAATMAAFKAGELHLLVATTVIEVGVDVANASLMVIENAERLGLAQLHQLRGRVGRGHAASHCLLLYQKPLSRLGRERLQVMRESTDGFVIAERDLALRGPGELLGTRQTGLLQMRIADLARDAALLDAVRAHAQPFLQRNPAHASALIRRWLPAGERYARV